MGCAPSRKAAKSEELEADDIYVSSCPPELQAGTFVLQASPTFSIDADLSPVPSLPSLKNTPQSAPHPTPVGAGALNFASPLVISADEIEPPSTKPPAQPKLHPSPPSQQPPKLDLPVAATPPPHATDASEATTAEDTEDASMLSAMASTEHDADAQDADAHLERPGEFSGKGEPSPPLVQKPSEAGSAADPGPNAVITDVAQAAGMSQVSESAHAQEQEGVGGAEIRPWADGASATTDGMGDRAANNDASAATPSANDMGGNTASDEVDIDAIGGSFDGEAATKGADGETAAEDAMHVPSSCDVEESVCEAIPQVVASENAGESFTGCIRSSEAQPGRLVAPLAIPEKNKPIQKPKRRSKTTPRGTLMDTPRDDEAPREAMPHDNEQLRDESGQSTDRSFDGESAASANDSADESMIERASASDIGSGVLGEWHQKDAAHALSSTVVPSGSQPHAQDGEGKEHALIENGKGGKENAPIENAPVENAPVWKQKKKPRARSSKTSQASGEGRCSDSDVVDVETFTAVASQ